MDTRGVRATGARLGSSMGIGGGSTFYDASDRVPALIDTGSTAPAAAPETTRQ